MIEGIPTSLQQRLGRTGAEKRVGVESDREVSRRGDRIRLFGLSVSSVSIRTILKLSCLYQRGCRNAEDIRLNHNFIKVSIPQSFDGFTILQLSDLHIDMNPGIMDRLANMLPVVSYDLCVMTGDYRGKSSGSFEAALAGMAKVRALLKEPIYGVLGDHDTIRMVPELEKLGIRVLLNESAAIERGDQRMHLAGIDDAHCFHTDDIGKAASGIPRDGFSILLSHTPEIYHQAAHADFKLLLSGHTHGGQICLPGGFPLTLEATLPRWMGAGPWKYERMIGYTSVGTGSSIVPVRFNCPPEITMHHLSALQSEGTIPDIELEEKPGEC